MPPCTCARRWRCLRLALTASLVDLLGGDRHAQTSCSSPLLISRTSSFHSACESRTVFASSPIVTPWSVISTSGHSSQCSHSVSLTGSILTALPLWPVYHAGAYHDRL